MKGKKTMKTQISLLALTLGLSTFAGLAQDAAPQREDRPARPEWTEEQPEARPQRRQRQRDVDQDSVRPQQRERRQAMLQDRQGPGRRGPGERNMQPSQRQRPAFDNRNERPNPGFQNRQQNRSQGITCPNCGEQIRPGQGRGQGPRNPDMDRPGNNPGRRGNAWNQRGEGPQGPRGQGPRNPQWNNEDDRSNDFAPMGRGPRRGFGPPESR
jgi:hypothetical protein